MFIACILVLHSNAQNKTAQEIVNACIQRHGGDNYKNAHYAFEFRKNHYEYHYDNGDFRYELHSKDGKTKDILSNSGFKRMIEGKEIALTDKEVRAFSSSVNSVHYFVFLPYFLNDPAVNKRLVGESTIKGKDYYKIEITFDQEGGGADHDDVHMYWINKETNTMDYMAYSFHVNGGGVRFRSAFNQRNIGGITFQDYVNFKYEKDTPLKDLDALYEQNKLIQVSRIETEQVEKI
jgi:hypothetical protein